MRSAHFIWFCLFAITGLQPGGAFAKITSMKYAPPAAKRLQKDTVTKTRKDSVTRDSAVIAVSLPITGNTTSIKAAQINLFPGVSLQQYLKGQAAGLVVQEPSGEPGTEQNILIHGTSLPLFSARDIFAAQPLLVVDGVQRISRDHPFAYDIQQYDYNRIGPATNLLADIDPDNIASIEVIRDPAEAAKYGARAGNGVIYIRTRQPTSKKLVSFNSYIGLASPNGVTTTNGATEFTFRKQFYDRYATPDQAANIPAYLRDSLYAIYYGPSNWTDLYYKNAMIYSANASISGGSDRANFRATLGTQSNKGVADQTGLNRYSASFNITMKPTEWLTISTFINGNQLVRDRNRYQRDRFAEQRYLPNLSNPISPNKDYYARYLTEYDKSFDNNKSNILNGYVAFGLDFGKLKFQSKFYADYSEGYRDIFYPSTLLETNSYVSNYFGYNQRLSVENSVSYPVDLKNGHTIELEAGQTVQWDTYKYAYGYAYRGSSDYIKINLLSDPKDPLTAFFSYQPNTGFLNTLMYRYLDKVRNNLASFYGRGVYNYKDKFSLAVSLRSDGASTAQPTNRWFLSRSLSAGWDIKNDLLKPEAKVTTLKLRASYARTGRMQYDDRFAAGPQYTVDLGYTGEPRVSTFSGKATLSRPYSQGWVGYDIPWAYSEQFNIGFDFGLFDNRLLIAADIYSKSDKNQLIGVPAFAEYGYTQSYEAGMNINNAGIDLTINAAVFNQPHHIQWSTSLNVNYNRNRLNGLPGGLKELVVGDRLLQVGKSVDQYWLYENQGIYQTAAEVPVNPQTGLPLSFQGSALKAGDPRWKDQNGDYIIDNADRQLKGHALPVISGGFNNNLRYHNWSMDINLYFNLGRDIINQDMAKHFDFINQESAGDINSVKEITFWEKRGDYTSYPLYNPWSNVTPYRAEQDLFLENGSFLKLRAVTLGYDLKDLLKKRHSRIGRIFIYGTVNNVFTLTPYSGRDPELVNYYGYDTGYGLSIPRTYTVGVKMDL